MPTEPEPEPGRSTCSAWTVNIPPHYRIDRALEDAFRKDGTGLDRLVTLSSLTAGDDRCDEHVLPSYARQLAAAGVLVLDISPAGSAQRWRVRLPGSRRAELLAGERLTDRWFEQRRGRFGVRADHLSWVASGALQLLNSHGDNAYLGDPRYTLRLAVDCAGAVLCEPGSPAHVDTPLGSSRAALELTPTDLRPGMLSALLRLGAGGLTGHRLLAAARGVTAPVTAVPTGGASAV